ncbi:MAG: LysR family transcriptional regulator [Clostridia bacterium]|nr:LysR family transcriptional regulator [Clostridia bacterium]
MNLVQLKYFHAVCTYRSVSGAAEFLYISQPTLSNAIKELENEFGVALFMRHHRGMMLTEEGEMLYKMSKELLSRAEQIENVMEDMGNKRKKLRLGVPPMIGSLVLPHIYRKFSGKFLDVTLEITEGGREEILQKLKDDYLDMVFVPHNAPFESNLAAQKIASLEVVCCAKKNSGKLNEKSVSALKLKNIPLVLFKDSFFQTEEIKKWFARSNVSPCVLLKTGQLSTVLSLISKDIAVGFLFRNLIENNDDLKAISLQEKMFADVSLVWKKDSYVFESMKIFSDFFKNENPFV